MGRTNPSSAKTVSIELAPLVEAQVEHAKEVVRPLVEAVPVDAFLPDAPRDKRKLFCVALVALAFAFLIGFREGEEAIIAAAATGQPTPSPTYSPTETPSPPPTEAPLIVELWGKEYSNGVTKRMQVPGDGLNGTIPTELGLMTKMTHLELGSNGWPREPGFLTGSIPTQLGLLTQLGVLVLQRCQLTGPIPSELGLLTKLSQFSLFSNQKLARPIPTELGMLTRMTSLDLSANEMTSGMPTELGLLTKLTFLCLSGNKLTGGLPKELALLTKLFYLDLQSNAITGSIPTELGLLKQMDHLELGYNTLTGRIPTELGKLTQMRMLELNSNVLTGPIPTELRRLTKLINLRLKNNTLSGSIPTNLDLMARLEHLDVSLNHLVGPIHTGLGLLTKLSYLHLSYNQLTGPLPAELGRLKRLGDLRLDNNTLTGSIPTELGLLTQLTDLRLDNNEFIGSVPAEIGLDCDTNGCYSAKSYKCETAFARPSGDEGCLMEDGFTCWGWSIQIPGPGIYTYDVYAGVMERSTSKGKVVGTVTIEYKGSEGVTGPNTCTGSYTALSGETIDEFLFQCSGQIYATDKNGTYCVQHAPETPTSDPCVLEDVVPNSDGVVYAIARATSCYERGGYYHTFVHNKF